MHDAIVIGNTTLDLFFIGDTLTREGDRYELAIGGKYVADNFVQKIGGGGANVSIGLARQGFSVIFWGILDDSLIGQYICEILESENINTTLMEKRKDSLSVSSILLSSQGERTIITHHASNVRREYSQKVDNILKQAKWLALGDSPGNSLEEKIAWAKFAKDHGAFTFTMLTAKECREGIRRMKSFFNQSDWLILNAHELADLLDTSYLELELNKRNYDTVLGVNGLIVTDGKNGAYAYASVKRYFQRAINPPRIVDTTGAGDAFAGAFLGELIRNTDVPKALLFASQNAASVIGKIGAQDGLLKR